MIRLAQDTINKEDINSVISWLNQEITPKLTKGDLNIELEKKFAEYMGVKYAIFCNSGSSAVYLSLLALKSKYNFVNPTVAMCSVCWLTDFSSVILNDMNLILLDCNLENYSVDISQLEQCFKKDSPDIYLHIHPLGLPNDISSIRYLCEKYNVLLIEDTCESLGTQFKDQKLGTFGDLSLFSFYFGHHISTIEGGMICTNDYGVYNKLLMLRSHGWTRDLDNNEQSRLKQEWNISDFENLYTMYELGLNFRNTDLHAFIGLEQLKKVDSFVKKRAELFNIYQSYFHHSFGHDPKEWVVSLMAYPILCQDKTKIFEILRKNDIECRPLIAGNIYKHPIARRINLKNYSLDNADLVHKNGLYLPCHHNLTSGDVQRIADLIKNYV
jgi:CDP-6-deoxy-D-xylo-4-hexulose-3-dehydrase